MGLRARRRSPPAARPDEASARRVGVELRIRPLLFVEEAHLPSGEAEGGKEDSEQGVGVSCVESVKCREPTPRVLGTRGRRVVC